MRAADMRSHNRCRTGRGPKDVPLLAAGSLSSQGLTFPAYRVHDGDMTAFCSIACLGTGAMEIVFADDDLARVRVWSRLDATAELVSASHSWRAPHRLEVLGGWAKRTITDLGPLPARVLQDTRSCAVQRAPASEWAWSPTAASRTASMRPADTVPDGHTVPYA